MKTKMINFCQTSRELTRYLKLFTQKGLDEWQPLSQDRTKLNSSIQFDLAEFLITVQSLYNTPCYNMFGYNKVTMWLLNVCAVEFNKRIIGK